jgi:hypothetical protein
MDEEVRKEEERREFEMKREELKRKDEEKTNKNRKRRMKKKEKTAGPTDREMVDADVIQEANNQIIDANKTGEDQNEDDTKIDAPVANDEGGIVIHDDDD